MVRDETSNELPQGAVVKGPTMPTQADLQQIVIMTSQIFLSKKQHLGKREIDTSDVCIRTIQFRFDRKLST